MSERRKKFWIRIIVLAVIAAFILPSVIVLFSRCQNFESTIKIDGEKTLSAAVNADYKNIYI